ncbi:heparinase II/III domain-containing protein [Roseibium sp. SCP14]|uniref:heparinase II/III domain-containing protein n=1 Tax=Roseibium sp. SCP14 TaxID=3141375 RepID=UPI00333C5895
MKRLAITVLAITASAVLPGETIPSAAASQASETSLPSTQSTVSGIPQILLTDDVIARLQRDRARYPDLERDISSLLAKANSHLSGPTIAEIFLSEFNGDLDALPELGEKTVERVTTLGMAWRLTGDEKFSARGKMELMGLARLASWNPAHFLGLSRISLAVALGYSWLAPTLGDEERSVIRSALINKGLRNGVEIYERDKRYFDSGWVLPHEWMPPVSVPDTLPDGTSTADIVWPVSSFNWNIACNAGMLIAAIAVSHDNPELSEQVLNSAQSSLQNGLALFAPDGAWPEGPMYGALSARDAALLIGALESVYGDDFDLSEAVGLPGFGDYLMHLTGPTGKLFNYGDSDTRTDTVVLPWLSTRFGRPDYDWRKIGAPASSHPAYNLIWRRSEGVSPEVREPRALWFGGLGLIAMRSAWNSADATYVGFKAGPLQSHHNNLDAGTFVIEAKGVRWAVELGSGNYNLPGYFTAQRFRYYRTATIGQNTLTFDNANQSPTGRAFIEDFAQFSGFKFAIADLSDPYGLKTGSTRRGVALINDDTVLVQDEIANSPSGKIRWTMHTEAKVELDGHGALLRQEGEQLIAEILSPPRARFKVVSANPCETPFNTMCDQQNPNTGIQRLMIELTETPEIGMRRISVLFSNETQEMKDVEVKPLAEWRLHATLE